MTDKSAPSFHRDNTSFTMQLFEWFSKLEPLHNDSATWQYLKYYQRVVRAYVTNVKIDSRGLLIMHGMGMGKSILAAALAIDAALDRPVIMLLTKALQSNMQAAVRKYIELMRPHEPDHYLCKMAPDELSAWIDSRFSWVSMNASNMITQMARAADPDSTNDALLEEHLGKIARLPDLNNKMLIVDEAHNLFRAIVNGSKNGQDLYRSVMTARNLRVMFLTGTPIASDPFELVPCFNMLGGTHNNVVLPENYDVFYDYFVKDNHLVNRGKFQNRLMGLVSFVDRFSDVGAGLGAKIPPIAAEFPTELPLIVRRVQMTGPQYVQYRLAREREKNEVSRGGPGAAIGRMTKPKTSATSTYRVRSRQLSTYCPPPEYIGTKNVAAIPGDLLDSPKFDAMLRDCEAREAGVALCFFRFTEMSGLAVFARWLERQGWTEITASLPKHGGDGDNSNNDTLHQSSSMREYMRKMEHAFGTRRRGGDDDDISQIHDDDTPQPHEDNDDDAAKIPNDMDISADIIDTPQQKHSGKTKTFARISGSVDFAERARIAKMVSAPENAYGANISIILMSPAGAEGIDLKNICVVCMDGPPWRDNTAFQIIARAVRNEGHIYLPKQFHKVQPYIYLAISPEDNEEPTTDLEMYNSLLSGGELVGEFVGSLKEISIECMVNGRPDCRVCAPDNSTLFTKNIDRDIRAPDPCVAAQTDTIRAEKLIVDGVEYHYAINAASLWGFDIFIMDDTIGNYVKLAENDPRWKPIGHLVSKKLKLDDLEDMF